MKIHSKRFQTELEFDDSMVITMPQGLLGFPQSKRFCILELDYEDSPFKWLHDVDDTSIALLITDPFQFFPEYTPDINEHQIADLSIQSVENDLMVFTIVKVSKGGKEAFTNLRAPVVVNAQTKVAKQIILESDAFPVKAMLFSEAEAIAATEERETAGKVG